MVTAWLPAALLVLAGGGLLFLRRLPVRARIATDAVFFAAISGWLLWHRQSPLIERNSDVIGPPEIWLKVIGAAWWLLGARLAASLIQLFLGHDRQSRETRLFSDLTAAAIYIASILVMLNFVLGLPIQGLLATSGVVAIVIGLALQNTLADVFAGIAVGVEQPFRVGDRIRLGDHIEGVVVQANWRSIRIQTDEDDIAIVPNSSVAKAEIINRSSPTQQRGAKIEVSCRASVPPERIIPLLEHAIMLCPDILEAPSPAITLTQLGADTNGFAIAFAVSEGSRLTATKSLLLSQVRRQFHHAGLLARSDGPSARLVPPSETDQLRDLVLFEALSDEQFQRLSERLQRRSLAPGDKVFSEGETDGTLYVIANGIVELRRCAEDRPLLGRVGPGEYLGEIGMLTGTPHKATAQALTYCEIFLLSHDALGPLLEEQPELAVALEASARRGIRHQYRDTAARATGEISGSGHLVARIRSFFRFGEVSSLPGNTISTPPHRSD